MKLSTIVFSTVFAAPDLFGQERDTRCTAKGGSCLDWRYYICTAGYETGLCNGDNNRR